MAAEPAAPAAEADPPFPLRLRARAKVNLHLHVLGRRADGLHLLDSLTVFPDIGDVVQVSPARDLTLSLSGPCAAGLSAGDDNLVMRAAQALRAAAGRPLGAALRLEKRLPAAGGIGGGSADAAATLRLLNQLWGLDLPASRLEAIGLSLGADLPVCLRAPTPCLMRGIGEALRPVAALPRFHLVLANPGAPAPTGEVFARLTRRDGVEAPWPEAGFRDLDPFLDWLRGQENMLTPPALEVAPQIAELLAALDARPGCALARMSGSGATCFGIFQERLQAEAAAEALRALGLWAEAAPVG